jgi:hypothetical protein
MLNLVSTVICLAWMLTGPRGVAKKLTAC